MILKRSYIGLLIVIFILVGCSSQAPMDSAPPSTAEGESTVSKVSEPEPSSSEPEPSSSEPSEAEASESPTQDSEEILLTTIDLGEPIGWVIDVTTLPDALRTIKTMYPSGIITSLHVDYYNTETKVGRKGVIFERSNENVYTTLPLLSNEIIAGYSITIVTKHSIDTVDAYYAALNPDKYVDYARKGNPYPIFNIDTPHSLGGEGAIAAPIGGGSQGRTPAQDDALKSMDYAAHISIFAEWMPKN